LGFQNVAVGRINTVAALTGFSCEKMYERFAWTKSGHNNEVAIRQGSPVLPYPYTYTQITLRDSMKNT